MRTSSFAGLIATVIATLFGLEAHAGEPPHATEALIATFSIVGCDPATGEVGAAVASMYPAVGKVVPFVRAGAGAFCSQYHHTPQFGPKALVMLEFTFSTPITSPSTRRGTANSERTWLSTSTYMGDPWTSSRRTGLPVAATVPVTP